MNEIVNKVVETKVIFSERSVDVNWRAFVHSIHSETDQEGTTSPSPPLSLLLSTFLSLCNSLLLSISFFHSLLLSISSFLSLPPSIFLYCRGVLQLWGLVSSYP